MKIQKILPIFIFCLLHVDCCTKEESDLNFIEDTSNKTTNQILSRRRRYIVFPKGASLQLVYCNVYLFRPVVDIFRLGATIGLAWQLPDDPKIFENSRRKHKIYKRNVFKKMEAFMKPKVNNSRHCILKALCESGQRSGSRKDFLHEILHKIFSFKNDGDDEDFEETEEEKMYRKAHDSINEDCETLYPGCDFSFFEAFQF